MKKNYTAPEIEVIYTQPCILEAESDGEYWEEGGAKAFYGYGDDEEEKEQNQSTHYNAWNTWGDNDNNKD